MTLRFFLTAVALIIVGLVGSYFLVGLIPVLWMGGAFLLSLLLFELGNFIPVGPIIAILSVIAAPIFFFFRFGWLTAVLFLAIAVVVIVVTSFTTETPLESPFERS
jgi:hypothetical protein